MTVNGWLQIAIFSVIIVALVKPFGAYMTRVFAGESTPLSPVLRPVERLFYWLCGVDEKREQNWVGYAVAMLTFSLAGFLSLYALMRFQALLPFNPANQSAIEQGLAFNTAMSFDTNTNWQSYVPETTMSYLIQMAGLTVHNFVSAATGICRSRSSSACSSSGRACRRISRPIPRRRRWKAPSRSSPRGRSLRRK
jgi:K+-transporting ATPase ATPase A chain